MAKIWQITKNIFFILIIVFSLMIILSSLNIFGYRMFIVKSGSMEPKIRTGSVVFDKKTSTYKVGDVVTFKIKDSKDTVTHRIVSEKIDANNGVFYTTKGDANNAPDSEPASKLNVVGKVAFSVPYMGYLAAFIRTLPGLIIFIIIPATIIVYEEMGKIKDEIKKIQEEKKKVAKKLKKEEREIEKWYVKHINKIKKWMEKNRQEAARVKEAKNEENN